MLTNGARPLDFVRVFTGEGVGPARTRLWGRVRAGEQLEICLCDVDRDDVVLTIAWFRPGDGLEYVWRFVV
ncbi:hypothetical protein GCM10025768_16630 [Microbacterium pseudoresistens]